MHTLAQNLAAGTLLATLTVLLHTGGLIFVATAMPALAGRLGLHNNNAGRTLVMTVTVLGILSILTIEIWTWAALYKGLGIVRTFDDALYLSTAMFSTIGYGDVRVEPNWRLLTALEGVTGFLMIGWSTAYLVRAATRHGPFRVEYF